MQEQSILYLKKNCWGKIKSNMLNSKQKRKTQLYSKKLHEPSENYMRKSQKQTKQKKS